MAKDNQIQMPGVFGGLMRYNEEYDSVFKLKPIHVIVFVVLLALGVLTLTFFFPITPVQ
ncbi:MAG: preprotein translocase subunit Sec61beta [Candidatus Pacearchaeota archaeon]